MSRSSDLRNAWFIALWTPGELTNARQLPEKRDWGELVVSNYVMFVLRCILCLKLEFVLLLVWQMNTGSAFCC